MCEPGAIRLCDIAFGRGRGLENKSIRPCVGLPTPAAWGVVSIGSYVWHDGALGRVRAKRHAGATIAVFTVRDMLRVHAAAGGLRCVRQGAWRQTRRLGEDGGGMYHFRPFYDHPAELRS